MGKAEGETDEALGVHGEGQPSDERPHLVRFGDGEIGKVGQGWPSGLATSRRTPWRSRHLAKSVVAPSPRHHSQLCAFKNPFGSPKRGSVAYHNIRPKVLVDNAERKRHIETL